MAGHMGNKNCTKTAVKVIIFLSLLFLFLLFSKRMILWNLDILKGHWTGNIGESLFTLFASLA